MAAPMPPPAQPLPVAGVPGAKPLDLGPARTGQYQFRVRYWRRMKPGRVYPMVVELVPTDKKPANSTTPPGDPAYNVSKAGVKAFTEALQHELRNTAGGKISAHLLIPGFVFTGLTARGRSEKPAGAWTPEQTVDFMIERIDAGDFYILCPDNDVPRPLDERRILWAAGDIVENRPALSRWHPDYAAAFKAFMERGG